MLKQSRIFIFKAVISTPSPIAFPVCFSSVVVAMPLHLLHHKSWHVYNTVNVDRVRRDQENARRKEEEEEMRMNQADQERRLQQLRGNAYGTTTTTSTSIDPSDPVERPSNSILGLKRSKNKHVNLFEDIEKTVKVEGNPEREKELAVEKKKWEDLVTSKFVNATKDHLPWYSQIDKVSGAEKEKSDIERELKEKKQEKWKMDADPMKQMERFLEKKREVDEREERKREKMERELTERERRRGRGRTPENDERRRPGKEERRHRRRQDRSRSRSPKREHRKHRHRHQSRSPSINIEQLRAEREKREIAEREKVEKLLRKKDVNDRYEPVGHGGYSAQFHPEAVRR
jgi:hypothetical protein